MPGGGLATRTHRPSLPGARAPRSVLVKRTGPPFATLCSQSSTSVQCRGRAGPRLSLQGPSPAILSRAILRPSIVPQGTLVRSRSGPPQRPPADDVGHVHSEQLKPTRVRSSRARYATIDSSNLVNGWQRIVGRGQATRPSAVPRSGTQRSPTRRLALCGRRACRVAPHGEELTNRPLQGTVRSRVRSFGPGRVAPQVLEKVVPVVHGRAGRARLG